jgi:glycosyltransferase involved in cell wall biosynthesis
MTGHPLVTVLLCVYNAEQFLPASLESVLTQSFRNFEVVVVDDGSSDGTPEVLSRFSDTRLRVIRNRSNVGLTKSLNIGLAAARGELIARQDADDLSHVRRLEKQVRFLGAHPEVAAVGAQARRIDRNGYARSLGHWPKSCGDLALRWQLMFDSPFLHSAVMFRREVVWDELGGYDETFRANQDFELWSRLSTRYELRNLSEVLIDFRTTGSSISSRYAAEDIDRVRLVLLKNRERSLRSAELAALGLDAWLRINNPQLAGEPPDLRFLVSSDLAIFRRFRDLYSQAREDTEIRHHRAVSLARVAGVGASCGAAHAFLALRSAYRLSPTIGPRLAAVYAFRRALHLSGRMAAVVNPRRG